MNSLERIGAGVKAKIPEGPDDDECEDIEQDVWVNDHLGVMADFTVVGCEDTA
jgi:hypothetical protein